MPIQSTTQAVCTCPELASFPHECVACPIHGADAELQVAGELEAELRAENAWLIAAEYDPRMADPREW